MNALPDLIVELIPLLVLQRPLQILVNVQHILDSYRHVTWTPTIREAILIRASREKDASAVALRNLLTRIPLEIEAVPVAPMALLYKLYGLTVLLQDLMAIAAGNRPFKRPDQSQLWRRRLYMVAPDLHLRINCGCKLLHHTKLQRVIFSSNPQ